jgi:hypothetical protein
MLIMQHTAMIGGQIDNKAIDTHMKIYKLANTLPAPAPDSIFFPVRPMLAGKLNL